MEIALIHQKNNLGPKAKPLGIRVKFTNNANGELTRIDFSSCDLAANPILSSVLPIWQQLINAFKDLTTATFGELSEHTGIPEASVKTSCYKYKNLFTKVDGNYWGLVT